MTTPADSIQVGFWGDVSFGLGVASIARDRGFDHLLEAAGALLVDDVLHVANFDCTITDSDTKNRFRDGSHLRTQPAAAVAMKHAGFHGVLLANNHIFDYGEQGVEDTLQAFCDAGIATAGIGVGVDAALKPLTLERNGIRIGIIACCALPITTSFSTRWAIAPLDTEAITAAIKRYRAEYHQFMVSVHWGREFVNYPFRSQVQAAQRLIEAGASAVVGHHAHVIGPVDIREDHVIAYGLGDFLFDQTDHRAIPHRHESIGLRLRYTRERLVERRVIPVLVDATFRPSRPSDVQAARIEAFVGHVSARITNPDALEQQANAQASSGFLSHQIRSTWKTLKHGGPMSVMKKAGRLRLLHIRLFLQWLKRFIRSHAT